MSIEDLIGSNFNDSLIGNSARNLLNGRDGNDLLNGFDGNDQLSGDSGNDQLFGGFGNDILHGSHGNDTLSGGAGADEMEGGGDNDTYFVDNTGDVTAEFFGGGEDTVQSSVSHTLAFEVENLGLIGTAAINGTGNGKNNTIVGNGAINTLNGGAGNDTLSGGAGDDTMNGGTGYDRLTGGAGGDRLTGGGGVMSFDSYDYNNVGESTPRAFSRDVITDFDGRGLAVGDRIDLSTIDANVLSFGNQAWWVQGPSATPVSWRFQERRSCTWDTITD